MVVLRGCSPFELRTLSCTFQHISPMSDVSLASIEAAAERIRPYVHRTPVVTSKFVDDLVGGGRKVFFKCELFQKTGSFKVWRAFPPFVGTRHAVHCDLLR
jgi:hypothetical protein